MDVVNRAISAPVLADAAGVLIAQQVADRRMGLPSMRHAGLVYVSAVAYDAALKPVVYNALPALSGDAAHLAAKAAAFVLAERIVGMAGWGNPEPSGGLIKSLVVAGAGLMGANYIKPMMPGGNRARGGAHRTVSDSVVRAAARAAPDARG